LTRLLLRLSGEHKSLPDLEALHLFSRLDPDVKITGIGPRLRLVDTRLDLGHAAAACQRLALTLEASEVLLIEERDPKQVEIPHHALMRLHHKTFLVRARGLSTLGPQTERVLGKQTLEESRRMGLRVSVSAKRPDAVLLVSATEGGYVLSFLLPKPRRSSYRERSDSRPFKQPVSIDPVTARAMVNMAGVLEGETLIDPFCGTGNILAEGGLVGARVFGVDFKPSMCLGTRENLQQLGIAPLLVCGDALRARRIFGADFDHVVTDPPYGRASASGRDIERLLIDFSSRVGELLGPGGTICMASPSTIDLTPHLKDSGLSLKGFAYQRIHGSLGRHLYLAAKSGR